MILRIFLRFFIAIGGIFLDKFGIFKLLNSFLTASGQKHGDGNALQNGKSADLISAISSIIQSGAKGLQTPSPPPEPPPKKVTPPLQSAMLNTMQSHDAFVNRVKAKSKV